VIGHKNPDTDSVCSAYALAKLRSVTDPEFEYLPARCGNINNQTRFVFEKVREPVPLLLKDVYPKVSDIAVKDVLSVNADEPVLNALNKIKNAGINSMPVINEDGMLRGLIGERDLIRLFIQEEVDSRPIYRLTAKDIPAAIKGSIARLGELAEFNAALMVGAMPHKALFERLENTDAKHTILVVGNRRKILKNAVQRALPAIIVTGIKAGDRINADISNYKGWIYLSSLDSAETIRRLSLASPVSSIMTATPAVLEEHAYVDSARDILLSNRQRLLPIVADGHLTGIITRSNLLKRYETRLILVDHNEPTQAVDGIESAQVVEIVDHHRLHPVKTAMPILYYAKPVGSTCTLVYQLYCSAGVLPDRKTAMLLMAGILSDTIMLKSPTATPEDEQALTKLSELIDLNYRQFGKEIFDATDSLSAGEVSSIVMNDFKLYSEHGLNFGIGQVEVVTLADLPEMRDSLLEELLKQKVMHNLDWAMLMITDIIIGDSMLVCSDFEAAEKRFTYRRTDEHTFYLPKVLSRKKQLLPEILRILEGVNQNGKN
jgi:manganese-dependent inorganic pyrophosphatase